MFALLAEVQRSERMGRTAKMVHDAKFEEMLMGWDETDMGALPSSHY